MNEIEKTLSNRIWIPVVLTIGFLGWFNSIDYIAIPILAVFCALIFIFCNDVKNIFPIIFAVPFLIKSIENTTQLICIGVAIGIFVVSAIYFVIKQFVHKTNMRKGLLFWPLIISDIAFIFGGVIGYFNLLAFLITIGLSLAIYFLYFLAINFCPDFKSYITDTFIIIGFMLFAQLLIEYLQEDKTFISAITSKTVILIGVQHINVVAIYFVMAMISSFQYACKNNKDYMYCLLSIFFAICTYFTYSRMMTLIGAIFFVIALIIVFKNSQNKKIFLISGFILLTILTITFTAFYDKISKFLDWHLNLGFSGNGRDALWPWCCEKFLDSPWIGIGFVSTDPVPTLVTTETVVLAHNTILQYLTSVGILGSIMVSFLYIQKYIILCQKFNLFKLFNLLQILIIALSGITDQAASMDFFIFLISLIFVSLAENDTFENNTVAKKKKVNKLKESLK